MNSQIVSDTSIIAINATALFAFGLTMLILCFSFRQDTLTNKPSRALFATTVTATVALISYGICFIHHPQSHDVLYFVSASIAYLTIYLAIYLYMRYVVTCINANRNNPVPRTEVVLTLVFCLVSAVLWMLSTGDGEYIVSESPETSYGLSFWVGHLGEWSLAVASILLIVWYGKLLREKKLLILFSLPAFLLAATLLEPVTPGISLRYPALAAGLLLICSGYHFKADTIGDQSDIVSTESDFALITNRVKPHFINNILSTIYYLCDMDLERAKKVTMDFSGYVSGTLGTVGHNEMIPFKRELDLIKNYIELETLRFGDRMTMEYATEETDFRVPPLTIQALIENSVKHGIAEKDGPGSVKLITRLLADGGIQIKVIDDGVGFDTSDPDKISGELALIRRRIEHDANGKMSVKSSPGSGTTVTIRLPLEEKHS